MALPAIIPFLPAIASAIGTGAGFLGSRKNAKRQSQQNQDDRKHERGMYDLQRQHAKDDFAKQNSYNSPQEQMNRLRQAGLNPNLVYGKGAANTADAVRSTSSSASSKQAPQVDYSKLGSSAADAFTAAQTNAQTRNINASTDNLYEQNNLIQKEAILKSATTAKTIGETATTKFQLEQSKQLKDAVINKANLENISTFENTNYTMEKNARERETARVTNNNTKTQTQSIKQNLKSNHSINASTAQIKKAEAHLRSLGINPSDPSWMRILISTIKNN